MSRKVLIGVTLLFFLSLVSIGMESVQIKVIVQPDGAQLRRQTTAAPQSQVVTTSSAEALTDEVVSKQVKPASNITSTTTSSPQPHRKRRKRRAYAKKVREQAKQTKQAEQAQQETQSPLKPQTKTLSETSYDTVINVNGVQKLKEQSYWNSKGNQFCKVLQNVTMDDEKASAVAKTLVNFTFGCDDLFHLHGAGTGNWISAFYAMRMAALTHGGVDVQMTCPDAYEQRTSLITPWLMGHWSLANVQLDPKPELTAACGNYNISPIGYMTPQIRHDLRRMAIALVGVPYPTHPAADFQKELRDSNHMQLDVPDDPLFPHVQLDDAVVHLRCGDLMNIAHPSFGFMKFSAYAKHLHNETQSIGIITQPFDNNGTQVRQEDVGKYKTDKCREIVFEFRDYLQERFPKARVSIHNDRAETIALTYARLVMAKQAISPISSFSVFPVLATFGQGYIRKPDYRKAPNKWVNNPAVDELYENIHLIREPNRLMSSQVKRLRRDKKDAQLSQWFRDENFCFDKPCIR